MYDQSEVKNFAENNRWLELILYVEKCFGEFAFIREKEQNDFKNTNYYEVHKFLIERQIKEYHNQNRISYIDFDKMIFNNEEVLLKDLSKEYIKKIINNDDEFKILIERIMVDIKVYKENKRKYGF